MHEVRPFLAQKNIGDVLIAWENEAWLTEEEFGKEKFEIVYPSSSILAEPPVAVVDKIVDERGTREAAEAYLKFLYTPAAQEIIATNHYRPRSPAALAAHASDLPTIPLFTVANIAGDWTKRRRNFSPTAECSIKFINPGTKLSWHGRLAHA